MLGALRVAPGGKPCAIRLPGRTETKPLISNDQYLKPMLDSGSSRVFNCNDRARDLVKAKAETPFFFRVPRMHGLVLIKEVTIASAARRSAGVPLIGTKLYLPYNQDDVYEGGRSIFYHDPKMLNTLNELFGLRGANVAQSDLEHDLKILGILDRLPSLDGFLMRDALELDGIATNDLYFEIAGPERAAINQFIRRKFEPLVRAACEDQPKFSNKVDHLIDKVWEAKDREALEPLIRAFRFPDDEALAIFAAWNAEIAGDVTLGKETSVWFSATIRADIAPITLGRGTNIQDGATVHVDTGLPCIIGAGVTVGHNAVLHGCTVGDDCLIGMGAVVLSGAVIGKESIVGAGALVTEGKVFPPRSLLVGSPAKAVKQVDAAALEKIRENARVYIGLARQASKDYREVPAT